jgi:hypothetical protein
MSFKILFQAVAFSTPVFINAFKNKIICSSLSDSVSVCVPTRKIIDKSTFMINHNFEVSPLLGVTLLPMLSGGIVIFNKIHISLTDIV